MSMFEYSKIILEKVYFEPKIFRKELRKALRQFSEEECKNLLAWSREKFQKNKFNPHCSETSKCSVKKIFS